jgi:DNA polymerase V
VYLETNPFIPGEPQYHPATLIKFSNPTDDTARLIQAARAGLRRIYKKEFRYKKAGVMLLDLQPAGVHQGDLFSAELPNRAERRDRLMATMDTINSEMGKGTLRFVAEGVLMPWKMRRENLTAGYTTSWEQLALAK